MVRLLPVKLAQSSGWARPLKASEKLTLCLTVPGFLVCLCACSTHKHKQINKRAHTVTTTRQTEVVSAGLRACTNLISAAWRSHTQPPRVSPSPGRSSPWVITSRAPGSEGNQLESEIENKQSFEIGGASVSRRLPVRLKPTDCPQIISRYTV